MKLKKIILSALVLMSGSVASAQQAPAEETVFNPHWYTRIQVGGQYTLGEVKFKDLLSPNVQLVGGYNFTSLWGARLSVNAWQSKAGAELKGQTYKWKYNYVAPMVDGTLNLTNLIGGFNHKRLVDVSLFAGIGANIAFNNDEANNTNASIMGTYYPGQDGAFLTNLWDGTKTRLTGRVGLDVDFNVCKRVAVGLEMSANTLSDRYNSKKAGNSDWYFNALLGAKINLGKTTKTRPLPGPQIQIVEKIVEKPVEKVVEKVVYRDCDKKVEPLRREIFFNINKTNILDKEMNKVDDIANYLKRYPSAKVSIIGYADKNTGNTSINASLAARRAKAVAKVLVEKYSISADRIITDSKGDTVQPFTQSDENRVSICIAE